MVGELGCAGAHASGLRFGVSHVPESRHGATAFRVLSSWGDSDSPFPTHIAMKLRNKWGTGRLCFANLANTANSAAFPYFSCTNGRPAMFSCTR